MTQLHVTSKNGSYNAAQLASNTMFQVRLLINDTHEPWFVDDAEIVFELAQTTNIFDAALNCVDHEIALLSHIINQTVDDLELDLTRTMTDLNTVRQNIMMRKRQHVRRNTVAAFYGSSGTGTLLTNQNVDGHGLPHQYNPITGPDNRGGGERGNPDLNNPSDQGY